MIVLPVGNNACCLQSRPNSLKIEREMFCKRALCCPLYVRFLLWPTEALAWSHWSRECQVSHQDCLRLLVFPLRFWHIEAYHRLGTFWFKFSYKNWEKIEKKETRRISVSISLFFLLRNRYKNQIFKARTTTTQNSYTKHGVVRWKIKSIWRYLADDPV